MDKTEKRICYLLKRLNRNTTEEPTRFIQYKSPYKRVGVTDTENRKKR